MLWFFQQKSYEGEALLQRVSFLFFYEKDTILDDANLLHKEGFHF